MAINKRRPLQPIFDEKKQMGAVDVGNSPGLAIEYCDDFDYPDGALGPPWNQQGGISVVSEQMFRSGLSRWAQYGEAVATPNMYVEYDYNNITASLGIGFVRMAYDGTLLTCYGGGYYPAYSSHPNGEWFVSKFVGVNAATWAAGGIVASALTPDPVGPIRVRVTCLTNEDTDIEVNVYDVTSGVPSLMLAYVDSAPDRITGGLTGGLSPGTDPVHTALPCLLDNFCVGDVLSG